MKYCKLKILNNLFFLSLVGMMYCVCFSLNSFGYVSAGDTPEQPIKITSLNDLKILSEDIQEGESYKGKYLQIVNDIYLTKNEKKNGESINWNPIGKSENNESNVFEGELNGNNKKIYINFNQQENEKVVSIFNIIGEKGVIKNLNICGPIDTYEDLTSALREKNLGIIENCGIKTDLGVIATLNERGQVSVLKIKLKLKRTISYEVRKFMERFVKCIRIRNGR